MKYYEKITKGQNAQNPTKNVDCGKSFPKVIHRKKVWKTA